MKRKTWPYVCNRVNAAPTFNEVLGQRKTMQRQNSALQKKFFCISMFDVSRGSGAEFGNLHCKTYFSALQNSAWIFLVAHLFWLHTSPWCRKKGEHKKWLKSTRASVRKTLAFSLWLRCPQTSMTSFTCHCKTHVRASETATQTGTTLLISCAPSMWTTVIGTLRHKKIASSTDVAT